MTELPKYPIEVNAFEVGLLTAIIWESGRKDRVGLVFEQLINLQKKFREEAGVKETRLPKGLIQLEDREGNTIIRTPHPWERLGGM